MNNKQDYSYLKKLDPTSIDYHAVYFDWFNSVNRRRWKVIYPDVSSLTITECQRILDTRGLTLESYELINISDWQNKVAHSDKQYETDFEPLVSLYYDIPQLELSVEVMQHRLRHLSVIMVLIDNEPKLATNSAGSHMQWQICEAFVALGCLPPFCCCYLPLIERYYDFSTVRACKQSIKLKSEQIRLILNRMKSIESSMKLSEKNDTEDTVFVGEVEVIDPNMGTLVNVSLYKDNASQGIFGIDSAFLENQEPEEDSSTFVIEPFNLSLVSIN